MNVRFYKSFKFNAMSENLATATIPAHRRPTAEITRFRHTEKIRLIAEYCSIIVLIYAIISQHDFSNLLEGETIRN
jgi:hypothetical protein